MTAPIVDITNVQRKLDKLVESNFPVHSFENGVESGNVRGVMLQIDLDRHVWLNIQNGLAQELGGRQFMVDRDALYIAESAAAVITSHVPSDKLATLEQFAISNTPALAIPAPENLIVPQPPSTPVSGFCNDVQVKAYDSLLLGVMYIAGLFPVAYAFENEWRLFRNVVPNPGAKLEKSSHGSAEPLGWHSDNPVGCFEDPSKPCIRQTMIPKVLGFVTLRNQDGSGNVVSTDVLLFETALKYMSPQAVKQLGYPDFQVNPPASNKCAPLKNVPLIVKSGDTLAFRFNADPAQIIGLNSDAGKALDEFREAMVKATPEALQFGMPPMSILLINNYRVAHARKSFDPGNDLQNARWLRRCYGTAAPFSGVHADRVTWPFLVA